MGIGLMPDSADYFSAAENLLAGRGLVVSGAGGATTPLVMWPPLYPLLLALSGLAGLPLVEASRWLAALFAAGTVLGTGLLVRRSTGSNTASLLASLLVLGSASVLETHSWALSEGPFMALALLTLVLVETYLGSGAGRHLLAGALVCGLACITRYAAAALLPAAVFALLRREAGPRHRWLNAGTFLFFAAAPVLLWFLRNAILVGSAAARPLSYHPIPGWKIVTGLDTVASWLVTYEAPTGAKYVAVAALVLSVAFLLLWRSRVRDRNGRSGPGVSAAPLVFTLCYLVLLMFSITFVDAFVPLANRTLAPLLPVLVALAVHLGHTLWVCTPRPVPGRLVLAALLSAWLLLWIAQTVRWVSRRSQDGVWYTSSLWRNSRVLSAVRSLPEDARIYSNVPEGVYFVTGRPASPVPSVVNHHTGQKNGAFRAEVDSLGRALAEPGTFLVYVGLEAERRWYLPTEPELSRLIGIRPVTVLDDGAVYVGTGNW